METYIIGNVDYTTDELDEIIDGICAVNGIQNVSYTVDEEAEVFDVICIDPASGTEYTEEITYEEFIDFVIDMS